MSGYVRRFIVFVYIYKGFEICFEVRGCESGFSFGFFDFFSCNDFFFKLCRIVSVGVDKIGEIKGRFFFWGLMYCDGIDIFDVVFCEFCFEFCENIY